MGPEVIASNLCLTIEGATLYHLGVLSSTMHMAWVRTVAGRLKGDYRYSNQIVYNNFPWPPDASDRQQQSVIDAADEVLLARANHPDSTLADLYDPLTMPGDLVRAHERLDTAVDRRYRTRPFGSEAERVNFLFDLYSRLRAPLVGQRARRARNRAARP